MNPTDPMIWKTKGHTQIESPPYILDKIRRQLHLVEAGQLEDLLSCDMVEKEYQDILRRLGKIT